MPIATSATRRDGQNTADKKTGRFSNLPYYSPVRLLFDTKCLQQFHDFLVAFAAEAPVLVGAGQPVPGARQHPCRLGAATDKNPNDPLLPHHDRGVQRRSTVVLF